MMPQQTIFCAVRRDEAGEFLDLTTASVHLAGATDAAARTSTPQWRAQNPLARIGKFEVVEVKR